MLGTYSYHEIIKKTVVGFGTLFNNIELRRTKGSKTEVMKVPLAYGPKQKFLAVCVQLETLQLRTRCRLHCLESLLRFKALHMMRLGNFHPHKSSATPKEREIM